MLGSSVVNTIRNREATWLQFANSEPNQQQIDRSIEVMVKAHKAYNIDMSKIPDLSESAREETLKGLWGREVKSVLMTALNFVRFCSGGTMEASDTIPLGDRGSQLEEAGKIDEFFKANPDKELIFQRFYATAVKALNTDKAKTIMKNFRESIRGKTDSDHAANIMGLRSTMKYSLLEENSKIKAKTGEDYSNYLTMFDYFF